MITRIRRYFRRTHWYECGPIVWAYDPMAMQTTWSTLVGIERQRLATSTTYYLSCWRFRVGVIVSL